MNFSTMTVSRSAVQIPANNQSQTTVNTEIRYTCTLFQLYAGELLVASCVGDLTLVSAVDSRLKWRSSVVGSYPQWQAKEPQGY